MSALQDFLERCGARADTARIMSADALAAYGEDVGEGLKRQGIIVEASPSSSATCLACDIEHDEMVEFVEPSDGSAARAFIMCAEIGRVEIVLMQLRRWRIDNACVAGVLVHQLRADDGAPSPNPADGLFRLGEVKVGGEQRQVFCAPCGLDAGTLQTVNEWRRPLILVAAAEPDLGAGFSVSMGDICRLDDQGLVLDWPALERACGARSRPAAKREGRPRGKGVGSMVLCWMVCHSAVDRFDSVYAFYGAAVSYVARHDEHPPTRAQLPRLVADAKRARGDRGPCRYQGCKAGIPPDLLTD